MKRTLSAGSVSVGIQGKPSRRWKVAGVPEFEPCWIARFSLPQQRVPKVESTRIAICEGCLADRRAGRPVSKRCVCWKEAALWAETRRAYWVGLWQQGRVEEMNAALRPRERMTFKPVFEVYGRCTLESADDNLQALRMVLELPSGRAAESVFVDELTPEWVWRFAALYQEYGRRGWTERKGRAETPGITAARWRELRGLDRAPVIDWNVAAKWNTSIRGKLRSVKAVLGQLSRDKYLVPIADGLPPLEKLLKMKLPVPCLDSRVIMEPGMLRQMLEDLERLHGSYLELWVALRLVIETGIRTVELGALQTSWLEVDHWAGRSRAFTLWTGEPVEKVCLVVRNREEEFQLKARYSRRVRVFPLSMELSAAIEAVSGGREGSIFGLEHKTAVASLLREASEWIREYVGEESTHTIYLFRKIMATVQTRVNGAEAGSDALGHEEGSKVTRAKYVLPESVVKPVSNEERVRALGTGRRVWRPAGEKG